MKAKLVLFDLDGTVYVSGALIDGILFLLRKLHDEGISYGFMTNNSSVNPDDYLNKLLRLGLPASKENIITSCEATVMMLAELKVGRELYIVGTERFRKYLCENGYHHNEINPNAVLVGFDLELTFEKLTKATRFLKKNVPLIASHPDIACPSADGDIPDAGMILAALEVGSGVKPLAVAGKPNKWIVEVACSHFNVTASEVVMVGDRLATDISMANDFNMRSVLVLTGVSSRSDVAKSPAKPSLVVESVKELVEEYWFGNLGWI